MSSAQAEDKPRHWGRDRLVDVQHVLLDLSLDLEQGRVAGDAALRVAGLVPGTAKVELDAMDLAVTRVTVEGKDARFDNDGALLTVTLDPPLGEGERRDIRVSYSASPRNGLHFVRPTPAYPAKQLQCWSQGEDEENRWWFPIFDYPNERATSETLIRVKKPLTVIANGLLLEVKDNGDGTRTWHHRMDFAHPSYLVSLAVGDWASRTDEWEGVQLGYHVPRARSADLDRTFSNTPRILALLSEATGLKYPYPTYHQTCVTDFMWGGMENITATTLNERTLHDARAHFDWDSDGLVAHEAAHQWFGDYVTSRDWSDVWLNEGFATYFGSVALVGLRGPDQEAVEFDGLRQSAISADAGANRRPVVSNAYFTPNELFDGHSYAKGAMILRMLRRELGDDLFRRCIAAHLADHAGQSVDSHDFRRSCERVTGRDLSRFFAQWLYGAGQPELEVRWAFADGRVSINVRQVQARDALVGLFDVPLDLAVLTERGVVPHAVRVTKDEETFSFESEERPEAVVADPGNWLLATITLPDVKSRESAFVATHATALGARLLAVRALSGSAGQSDATNALVSLLAPTQPWALRREAATSLGSARTDTARSAILAALASETDSRVRSALAAALGSFREDAKAAAVLEQRLASDDSYAVRAAAARALGTMRSTKSVPALEAALSQTSHRNEVAGAACDALRDLKAPRLRAWCEKNLALGTPAEKRDKAMATLVQLALASDDKPFKDDVRERLVRLLDDPLFSARIAAATQLGTLGDPAALGPLKTLLASAPETRIRKATRDAVKAVETARDANAKMADLARQLADEKDQRAKLEERIKKLENRLDGLGHEKGEP